jgi:hypothetical protein
MAIENIPIKDYQDYRSEIRFGDLFFCSGNYAFSKLIREASNSPFSHVGILIPWNNRIYVMESVEDDGVRMQPLSNYLVNYENTNRKYNGKVFISRHNRFPSDQSTALEIIGLGTDLLNCKYDREALIRIASRIIFGGRKKIMNKEFICSEFVEECLKPAGIKFTSQNGYVLPGDISNDPDIEMLCRIL